MNRRRPPALSRVPALLILLLICAGLPCALAPAQTKAPAKSDELSPLEQEVINEMNLARTRPVEYAAYLEQSKQYYQGKNLKWPGQKVAMQTVEGVAGVDEAIKFLRSTLPLPPLGLSKGMCQGAKDQVADQSVSGAIGHEGSDKSFSWDRVKRYGEWKTPISENISYEPGTARQIVIGFIIDDGVPSRGHRKNIFNAKYFVAGISAGKHPVYGSVCVITFAGGFTDKTAGGQPPTQPAMTAKPATTAKPVPRKL